MWGTTTPRQRITHEQPPRRQVNRYGDLFHRPELWLFVFGALYVFVRDNDSLVIGTRNAICGGPRSTK